MSAELITCPNCTKQDTLEGFDVIGACGNNIFCMDCHCEFDANTGAVHVCNISCNDASLLREGFIEQPEPPQ